MSLIKMNLLKMETAREQLMEDIDCIVDEFCSMNGLDTDAAEELCSVLCEHVCINFPMLKDNATAYQGA
jgi:hypothetical protein